MAEPASPSSRREEKRIAQGETLGDYLPKEYPPRRGGAKRKHGAGSHER